MAQPVVLSDVEAGQVLEIITTGRKSVYLISHLIDLVEGTAVVEGPSFGPVLCRFGDFSKEGAQPKWGYVEHGRSLSILLPSSRIRNTSPVDSYRIVKDPDTNARLLREAHVLHTA